MLRNNHTPNTNSLFPAPCGRSKGPVIGSITIDLTVAPANNHLFSLAYIPYEVRLALIGQDVSIRFLLACPLGFDIY